MKDWSIEDIERIENHILGRMGTEEAQRFEHMLAADIDLQKKYKEIETGIHLIQLHRANELKEYIRKNARKPARFTFWQVVISYSVAACILFMAIFWVIVDLNQPAGESTLAKTRERILKPWGWGHSPETLAEAKSKTGDLKEGKGADEIKNTVPPVDSAVITENVNMEDESVSIEHNLSEEKSNAAVSEADLDQLAVKSDYMLRDTNWMVAILKEKLNDTVENEMAYSKAPSRKETMDKKKESVSPSSTTGATLNAPRANEVSYKMIKVEFWESPIHYKGYRFNGRTLILFGISAQGMQLKWLGDDLYLIANKSVYRLENNDRFSSYYLETDPKIIRALR